METHCWYLGIVGVLLYLHYLQYLRLETHRSLIEDLNRRVSLQLKLMHLNARKRS